MGTIVSPIGRGQGYELVNKLEAAGLDSDLAQRVIDSKGNELAVKVVRLISNGGFEATTSQKGAREIMGANYFGVEEAIKHFGVTPSRQETLALSEIPFTEATLEQCKKTHVLVAAFPLSILEIRGKACLPAGRPQGQRLFYDQDWYSKEVFAKEKGETEWKLVRKTPVVGSMSKTWPEQQALLAHNEETPTARVMVYAIIGHFLAMGERLFERIYVRSSDVGSHGNRVNVGNFGSDGLSVDRWDDDVRSGSVGVGASRKSK